MSEGVGLIGKFKKMDRKAKAGLFYLFGNTFDKAISFLVLPIFTRLLTTEEYGLVSNYLSIQLIISTFIGLNLGNTVRNAFVDYKDDLDDYISTMFVTGCASSIVITIIVYVLNGFMNLIQPGYLVFLCCVQAFMSGVFGAYAMRYMMSENYIKRTVLLVAPNLVVTIVSVVVLLCVPGNRYLERVFVYFSVYAIVGGILLLKQIFSSKKKFVKNYLKYALPLSIPIIFHTLSTVILSQSDRTMITALYGASENGIYSVVYSFGMLALVLTTSAENVWIPWFTQKMINEEKEGINNVAKTYILIISFVIISIMFVSPEILVFMAGNKYAVGVSMIPPIIIASFFIFLTSFSINLEYFKKKTVYIARNTVISGVVNIGLNFWLIPTYGGLAAAYTTVVGYVVNFVLHYFNSRKMDRELFPWKIYVAPIAIIICGGIVYYLTMNLWVIRWGLGIAVGLFVIIKNKKMIISLIRSRG